MWATVPQIRSQLLYTVNHRLKRTDNTLNTDQNGLTMDPIEIGAVIVVRMVNNKNWNDDPKAMINR